MRLKLNRPVQLILKWFAAVLVVLTVWFSLSPAPQHRVFKSTVHVKVEKPSEVPELAGVGAEKSQPQVATLTLPLPPKVIDQTNIPKPQIAIVIDDVGLDLKGSKRAIDFPASITLSFLPYATHLKEQARDARENGHELLLHMPMEPVGHDNPGPGALLVDLPQDEIRQRFQMALASFVGFDGVNNHMGSKFTADQKGMEIVIDELQQRHLFFFDSRTTTKTLGENLARNHHLPTVARDIFLDDDENLAAIKKQLDLTERIALHRGYAVAIGHPHGVTLDALEAWIPEVQKRGFKLIPLHDLVKDISTKP